MSERKDKHFIKKPQYPGGQAAFKKFISDNLKYPEEALKQKIEGTVVLKYSIDFKGKVGEVKIIKSLGYGCDEEAARVIRMLEFEVPKEPRKLRVLFHKESKIFFKLPEAKAQAKIQYSITRKKEEKKQDSSYNYTIEW